MGVVIDWLDWDGFLSPLLDLLGCLAGHSQSATTVARKCTSCRIKKKVMVLPHSRNRLNSCVGFPGAVAGCGLVGPAFFFFTKMGPANLKQCKEKQQYWGTQNDKENLFPSHTKSFSRIPLNEHLSLLEDAFSFDINCANYISRLITLCLRENDASIMHAKSCFHRARL